jgi:thiamine monophosphate synthase
MTWLAFVIVPVLAFVAGVTEAQRVINAVNEGISTIHLRLKEIEDRMKEKL